MFVPYSVYGIADIENQIIVAESKDGEIILSLEFGENLFSRFEKIIPNFQSGSMVIGDSVIEITEARAKFMGNSFVVHSEDVLIYARGVENEKFQINSYLLGGNQLESIELTSVEKLEENLEEMNKSSDVETIVLVQQDIRTFWNENYDIEIKVFDKSINPHPQFYQSLGAIDQANVKVILKDLEGSKLTELTGKTNSKGFWEDDYFILQNIVTGGTYVVEVNVNYQDLDNFQKFETFIIADTRASDSN